MGIVTHFLFLDSKITVGGDCSHEIRRWLLLGKKTTTNLDKCVEKQRHSADKGLCSQGYSLPSVHVWLWEPDGKEGKAPKNSYLWTVVLEKTPVPWTARSNYLELTSQPWGKSTLDTHCKDWCWISWCEQPTHWKSPRGWERLRAEEEKGIRGWDDWMASLTKWTWTRANFGRWWETGRPGVLQSMGLQRVGQGWVTEQQRILTTIFEKWNTIEQVRDHHKLWGQVLFVKRCSYLCMYLYGS